MTVPPDRDHQLPPDYEPYFMEPVRSPASWPVRIMQFFAVVGVIIVLAIAGAALARRLADGVAVEATVSTIAVDQDVALTVPRGATASDIGVLLQSAGLITDSGSFERTVRIQGVAEQLKAGDYVMTGGTSINDLIGQLIAGPPAPDTFRLTVIEGLRIEEMLVSLADQTDHTAAQYERALLGGSILSPYLPDEIPEGVPLLTAWEGLLFPATYEFLADATAEDIVGRLVEEMNGRMAAVDWSLLEEEGLTPYDGLIIASLIEKEAKLEIDRPLISSVIHNRLVDERALQIDATIIYALGENPGRVLERDLEIDSPWNTYLNVGLPPTPIGGVRTTSLAAAARPAETSYYYYVVVDFDGTHGFSETLEEHNEKVAKARDEGVLP